MRWLVLVALVCACGQPQPHKTYVEPPAAIARAAAMVASCIGFGNSASQLGRIFEEALASGDVNLFGANAGALARFVACAGKSNDCPSAFACASQGRPQSWCEAHRQNDCEGSVNVTCIAGWPMGTTDCSDFGQSCYSNALAHGGICGRGTCVPGPALPACNGSEVPGCDTNLRVDTTVDCAAFAAGGTCASDPARGGVCISAPTKICPAMTSTVFCDGSALVVCDGGGVSKRIDCASFGAHCGLRFANASPDCLPAASDCDPDAFQDGCDGNALRFCLDGKIVSVPCSSIGLSTCKAGVCA